MRRVKAWVLARTTLGAAPASQASFQRSGAEAPAVAGGEALEAELRARGGEVVAAARGEGEEVGGDADADGVAAAVGGAGVAAAVAEEAGHRVVGAGLQRLAEDVEAGVELGLHGQYPVISR